MRPGGANPGLGISYKIASVFTFTLMSVCVKAASAVVPTGQVCFFRAFFALLTIIAFLAWRHELPSALYTPNFKGHALRGILGLAAMFLNFAALGLLPLPDAIAINFATPLFVAIFAALLLGEVVRSFRWAAILIGLCGVLIILWPRLGFLRGEIGATDDVIGAGFALAGAVVIALCTVIVSKLVTVEKTSTVVFYFSAICSVGSLFTLPFGWTVPDPATLAMLVASGVLGGVAQLLVTQSYVYAETSTVAPFQYVSMLFGVALGYVLFSEVPTVTMLVGATVVIAAGLLILWREHRPGDPRATCL